VERDRHPTWGDWIGLYALGTANTAELAFGWIYLSCTQGVGAVRASGSCAVPLPSWLTPGSYELRLFPNSYAPLTTSNGFTVTP
jgi:hypothetical protein